MADPTLLENEELREMMGSVSFYAQEVKEEVSANIFPNDDFENIFKRSQEAIVIGTNYNKYASDTIFSAVAFKFTNQRLPYSIISLSKMQLNVPFEVYFEANVDGFTTVWSDLFGVSGIGKNREEAMVEFEELLLQDYNSLKGLPSASLSDGAKELLKRYKAYLG